MTRGINAAIWVISALLAITLLSGLGFYALADVNYASDSGDTNRVLDKIETIEGSATGGSGVVESFTVGALNSLQILWIAITDTSEVIMIFIPWKPIADTAQILAQITMALTMIQAARGVAFE